MRPARGYHTEHRPQELEEPEEESGTVGVAVAKRYQPRQGAATEGKCSPRSAEAPRPDVRQEMRAPQVV